MPYSSSSASLAGDDTGLAVALSYSQCDVLFPRKCVDRKERTRHLPPVWASADDGDSATLRLKGRLETG